MKNEFKWFSLEKLGLLTIVLELFGAIELIVGLKFKTILIISSLGLALLMLIGLIVKIKLKGSIRISQPALFYMVLNTYMFGASIK